jgi:hypothetical protein
LQRLFTAGESTIGIVRLNGMPFCFSLEDLPRKVKISGKTGIPAGKYSVAVTFSQRFQRPLPLLLAVPGFEGVRIHAGNTSADTSGCILVGQQAGVTSIMNSRSALEDLHKLIVAAIARKDPVTITVESEK